MGSFNAMCSLSKLEIVPGDKVAVLVCINPKFTCNFFSKWEVFPFIFFGEYDDYGHFRENDGQNDSKLYEIVQHIVASHTSTPVKITNAMELCETLYEDNITYNWGKDTELPYGISMIHMKVFNELVSKLYCNPSDYNINSNAHISKITMIDIFRNILNEFKLSNKNSSAKSYIYLSPISAKNEQIRDMLRSFVKCANNYISKNKKISKYNTALSDIRLIVAPEYGNTPVNLPENNIIYLAEKFNLSDETLIDMCVKYYMLIYACGWLNIFPEPSNNKGSQNGIGKYSEQLNKVSTKIIERTKLFYKNNKE